MRPHLFGGSELGCRGSFRAPSIDNQVNIRSPGILGRRIHVNVDFDTEREYFSNNDAQIYYEGLEDEIVRRVDVGTITLLSAISYQPMPWITLALSSCHAERSEGSSPRWAKSAIVNTAPVLGFRPVHLTTHS